MCILILALKGLKKCQAISKENWQTDLFPAVLNSFNLSSSKKDTSLHVSHTQSVHAYNSSFNFSFSEKGSCVIVETDSCIWSQQQLSGQHGIDASNATVEPSNKGSEVQSATPIHS